MCLGKVMQEEAVVQFLLPLLLKVCRNEKGDTALRMVNQKLPDDHPRLNGFPQTDFVREQITLNRVMKHAADHVHLVVAQVNSTRQ
ncbi:hypothetical protein BXU09_18925 [Deinococcus sp. LM3]|nr:hypothetical protein BXU09_18925 [Deinococcus sp. LM3]